jgi:hypothetical protein
VQTYANKVAKHEVKAAVVDVVGSSDCWVLSAEC